jgi:2-polyprenyl-3-methyl-5-hydroxy-6-metoxy-1,4-benzoquinol methylase
MLENIIEFYFHCDEDSRMSRHPLEYMRCKEIISRYLLRDNLRIADIGGATGAFSFWLAEQGHKVSLLDFVPKHIHIAEMNEKEKGIKLSSIMIGDARELPYQDDTFDVVLLMGPLYHLAEKRDRIRMIDRKILGNKNGGVYICMGVA